MWYIKLSFVLKDLGFTRCELDHSIFLYHNSLVTIILLSYVDDLLITSSDLNAITTFKKSLENHFKIKDLGILKYLLGLEIFKTPIGLYVGQRKYALDLLNSYNYLDSKPFPTPCTTNTIAESRTDNYFNPSLVIQSCRHPINSTKPESNNKALTDIKGYQNLVG